MAGTIRFSTYNVENLFSRAKLLNFKNNEKGDVYIAKVGELQKELAKKAYDGAKILDLYGELTDYIKVEENQGKLFNRAKSKVTAKGCDDWNGFIKFKEDKFSETARKNAAKVIRTINADVCCMIEVESRPVLKHFCSELLPNQGKFKKYRHCMLIDGNDTRGIDVGVVSRFPIKVIRSHVDDVDEAGKDIFSRDCLELEIGSDKGPVFHLLINHLKSKGYGVTEVSDAKRKKQATRVAEILKKYDLKKDYVIVAGDFNDTPDSDPLKPLLKVSGLHDVLGLKFTDPADRWTYNYKKNQQIDYMLVSEPMKKAFNDAGVERRGIFGVEKFSKGTIQPFPTLTKFTDGASDHAAVWAEFNI